MNEAELMWRVGTMAELWMPQETEARCVHVGHLGSSSMRRRPLDEPRQQDSLLQGLGSLHPAKLHQTLLQEAGLQAPSLTAWLTPDSPHKVRDEGLIPFSFLGHGLFLHLEYWK